MREEEFELLELPALATKFFLCMYNLWLKIIDGYKFNFWQLDIDQYEFKGPLA